MRIGEIPGKTLHLNAGDLVHIDLSLLPIPGDANGLPRINIPFPGLQKKLRVGGKVLLDDGNIEFQIKEIREDAIIVTVNLGGDLTSHKGFNLPGIELDIPGFTEKDKEDLHFGLDQGVDIDRDLFCAHCRRRAGSSR